MKSPTAYNGRKNTEDSIFTTPKWPSSRRTPSVSSSSSISSASNSSIRSSFHEDSPPASPSTPLSSFSSGGIPFSWETIPGIPKKQIIKRVDSSRNHTHLPLPPAAPLVSATKSNRKKHIAPRKDPFYAALVECSKGDNDNDNDNDDKAVLGSIWRGAKQARSISDRFGFVNNMSCKNSSVVSESLVLLPRGPRRIAYDLVKKRSG